MKELTVQEVVQGIKEHKELIQQQVRQGDAKAKALTDFYYIAQRHSDTSSRTLLIRAYEDWARQNLIPLFDIKE